jgi:hypothetical protein
MTDKQFFELIDQLVEHGKLRRQQSLQAADVEQFKEWDSCLSRLETMVSFRRLKELIKSRPAPPAQLDSPKPASKTARPAKRKKSG